VATTTSIRGAATSTTRALLPTRRHVVLLIALTLIWGGNRPIMKLSLREVTPLWIRALTITAGVLASRTPSVWTRRCP
jgi:hypothetical protein